MLETFPVPLRGIGKPDYTRDVSRSKSLLAYLPEYGEIPMWIALLCVDVPGPGAITRGPLAIGETAPCLDLSTGLPTTVIPIGWDFIVKDIWISFSQDVILRVFQGGSYNDWACYEEVPAGRMPLTLMQIGVTRGLLEPLTAASSLAATVENIGGGTATGKCWIAGYMKKGLYLWL